MSWLSSLFSGDKSVSKAASSLMATGTQATGQGMGDVSTAQNFFNQILSGGAAKALAPQISSIEKQQQQQVQQAGQFGTRSGGTAATMAAAGDVTRANINDLISSMTGTAASNIGSLGTNLLGIGTGASQAGANLQLQNKSLFSSLLSDVGSAFGGMAGKAVGAKLFK